MTEGTFSKWWYVPLALLLGFVLYQPVKQIGAANSIAEAITLKNIPVRSFSELVTERDALYADVLPNGAPAGDPFAYYRFIQWSKQWEAEVSKFMEVHAREDQETLVLTQMLMASESIKGDVQQKYRAAFGGHRMLESSEAFWKTNSLEPPRAASDYARVWPSAFRAYWLGALIYGLGILPLWIKQRGMMVWYEVPRIVMASLTFFASWFVFPVRIDQTRQMKSALEFASGVIMFFCALGGAGGSLAKAQTAQGAQKDLGRLLDKKKRQQSPVTVTLSTSVVSELPSAISGSIFNAAPNLQTTLRVARDNGTYVSFAQWKGLDHLDPNANMGDWVVGAVGYTHSFFKRLTGTFEGSYMDSAPLSHSRGDTASVRGTFAYAMGDGGRGGTIFGAVRELWKTKTAGASKGTYGYLGYRRPVHLPPSLAVAPAEISGELRLDPGNIGRGASVGSAERFEFPLFVPFLLKPKSHWSLRPFVVVQGPIWKDASIKMDNRSWEVLGGATLAFSFRI